MGPGYGYITFCHIGSEPGPVQNSVHVGLLREAIPGIICGFQASTGKTSALLQRATRSWVQIKSVTRTVRYYGTQLSVTTDKYVCHEPGRKRLDRAKTGTSRRNVEYNLRIVGALNPCSSSLRLCGKWMGQS